MSILPDINSDLNAPGTFLGKGLAWPFQEDPNTGDLKRASDEDSIEACMLYLLETEYGEIPLAEDQGTRLRQLLFQNDLIGIEELVTDSVETAIREKERRVQLISTSFEAVRDPINPNRLGVTGRFVYRVKATGQVAELVAPFNLELGT